MENKAIWNNDEHSLKPYKDCEKCSFTMSLEAKENVKTRQVTYVYECKYKNCLHTEVVE